jgi:hypothetical protein
MKHRPITGRFFPSAGPQALAVFSCALALLAINPAALRADGGTPTVLSRVQGQPISESGDVLLEQTPLSSLPAAPIRAASRRSKLAAKTTGYKHSVILHTVALFNAALVSHFVPLTHQPILAPEDAMLSGQPSIALWMTVTPPPSPAVANREQQFVLARLLLAPPV